MDNIGTHELFDILCYIIVNLKNRSTIKIHRTVGLIREGCQMRKGFRKMIVDQIEYQWRFRYDYCREPYLLILPVKY